MRVLLAALLLAVTVVAEARMSVQQLRGFIESSRKLGHSDKQVADYLKNVRLTERLDAGTVEDLQAIAGPRTVEALRKLSEATKSLPAPPPPAPVAETPVIPPPTAEEQKRILDHVRGYALDYSKKLPNFICTQVTRRYVDPAGLEFWQQQDVITAKLSFFEQKEDYKVILVNNRYVDTTLDKLGGSTSTGEFGSWLKQVFEPKSLAQFRWERWGKLRGRKMHVFWYSVAKDNSEWSIAYRGEGGVQAHTVTGYRGLLYVDEETLSVMRITAEATDIPLNFPLQQTANTLDYDFVNISSTQYVLPLKAQMRMREGRRLYKNDTEFRMYNRFGAEATITFTPDPISDEQLKEGK